MGSRKPKNTYSRTPGDAWSEDHENQLRKLWPLGLSAREIGVRIGGYTRNAIIGKAGRLGLPPHATSKKDMQSMVNTAMAGIKAKTKRFRAPKSGGPPRLVLVKPSPSSVAIPIGVPVTAKILCDLSRCECRWYVGPDPGRGNMDRQLFCGEVTLEGSSWCDGHLAAESARLKALRKGQPKLKRKVA